MIRHEIPTHLDVEDTLLGPLTTRDALYVLVGVSAAYGIGTNPALPSALRLALAGIIALGALLFALVKIQGRPFEEWLFATLVYLGQPKRSVWKLHVHPYDSAHPGADVHWHSYQPRLRWRTLVANTGHAPHSH